MDSICKAYAQLGDWNTPCYTQMSFGEKMRLLHRSKWFILALGYVLWVTLASTPASAVVDVPGDMFRDTVAAFNLNQIRKFRRDGMKIIEGSECEKVLMNASRRLGRPLTQNEILENYSDILKATGETLEPESLTPRPTPSPVRRSSGCFTGNMTVATPSGPKRIMDLLEGDELISIDLVTRQPVANRIHKIHPYAARNYGRLVDLPAPIDVTDRHRFLARGKNVDFDFHAIGDLNDHDEIFFVDLAQPPGRQWRPVPRGCYVPQPGTRTVYDIELVGEPRNFIVEGILVHNIKM